MTGGETADDDDLLREIDELLAWNLPISMNFDLKFTSGKLTNFWPEIHLSEIDELLSWNWPIKLNPFQSQQCYVIESFYIKQQDEKYKREKNCDSICIVVLCLIMWVIFQNYVGIFIYDT